MILIQVLRLATRCGCVCSAFSNDVSHGVCMLFSGIDASDL